jgi:hypothetical protein
MDTQQIISLILLLCLAVERILKNSKTCKSKCCGIEIEQNNMSPRAQPIEITAVNKKGYTSEPSVEQVLPAQEVLPQSA